MDIRAQKQLADGNLFDLQIECKKANPEFVNWIFFEKRGERAAAPFRMMVSSNQLPESGQGEWSTTSFMQTGKTDMRVTTECREVRGDYASQKGGSKTKTANSAIQDASYQVALANRAIVQEDGELLKRARGSGNHPKPPWNRKNYLPVIVTTANLYRVDFAASEVDISTGEIARSAARLVAVDSLVYEYPLPKHLQHTPADPLPSLSGTEIEAFTRMDIIVVNAKHLRDLLNDLR